MARITVAPSAAGSSASRPTLRPSSVLHQQSDRARSASRASSMRGRTSRSARCRTAPGDTPRAQDRSVASVIGVANRVSSTTLSMDRSPSSNASVIRGRDPRAWAAPTHRWAFHQEIP
jgi:hypothetical protein